MNKSASISMPSLMVARPLFTLRQTLIILALMACLIPWVTTPGTSLTLNVYDLAEWASLTPMAHNSTPMLFAPMLLRLPLSLTALLLVSSFKGRKRIQLIIVAIAAIALLPPFEFITRASDDPNYRQQFALAIVTLIAGIILVNMADNRLTRWGMMTLSALAIIAAAWGLSQAYAFMQQYSLPVSLGLGGIGLIISLLVLIAYDFTGHTKTRQSTR